jgi:signal transduction histidine kinase
MQLFLAFVAATALLFGAAVAERRAATAALAQWSRSEGVGALAGAVAHDFGNFLAVILATADAARQELPEGHAVGADLDAIAQAGRSAAQLTRQLLALTRSSSGRVEQVDLAQVVLDMERMVRHLSGPQARLAVHVTRGPLPVLVDRVELERVLCNLVSNARGAVRVGGSITIEVAWVALPAGALRAGGREGALLRVTDDGHGMDPRTLERIFEPFFTTKESGQGTGLGLAAVQDVVRRARGTIEVSSVVGEGTTVSVVLPLAEREPREPRVLA